MYTTLKHLNTLHVRHADNIINKYIKDSKDMLLPTYTKLFNCILDNVFIPSSWLEGTLIPIYKNKGNSEDHTNYRPITILSCLCKLFTSTLNERLTRFLENSNILNENQAGLRKEYVCTDHIFILHSLTEIMKNRKQKLFCGFIDFSQAFGNVWRAAVWHKLLNNHINGKFYTVIYNMYQISSQTLNIMVTRPKSGSYTGENLSPAMFSLFLNDLHTYMEEKALYWDRVKGSGRY